MHSHHGPTSGSQPEGFSGEAFCSLLLSFIFITVCGGKSCVAWYVSVFNTCVLCAGLPGSLNRSSVTDIKQEEKEDDENCSITDKSEDDRKEIKIRPRTRFLHFLFLYDVYT